MALGCLLFISSPLIISNIAFAFVSGAEHQVDIFSELSNLTPGFLSYIVKAKSESTALHVCRLDYFSQGALNCSYQQWISPIVFCFLFAQSFRMEIVTWSPSTPLLDFVTLNVLLCFLLFTTFHPPLPTSLPHIFRLSLLPFDSQQEQVLFFSSQSQQLPSRVLTLLTLFIQGEDAKLQPDNFINELMHRISPAFVFWSPLFRWLSKVLFPNPSPNFFNPSAPLKSEFFHDV